MMKKASFILTMMTALLALVACSRQVETVEEAPLLPHTFYYLGKDKVGLAQVFRMERDGERVTQLTYEPVSVLAFDASVLDGSVAYVANHHLSLVNADGSDRRVLVRVDPQDPTNEIQSPVFSPDGKTLAYGFKGLNLYDLATGVSRLVIENRYGEVLPGGGRFPLELYWPDRYSPDGTKLLVALGHWESAPSTAIYDLTTGTLVRYTGGEEYIYCCSFFGGAGLAPDGSSFYAVASAYDFAFAHGALWEVDAANGAVTTLISSTESDGTLNLPYKPHLAPDGNLYYFFLNYQEPSGIFIPAHPPLQIVRSAPGSHTQRSVLHAATFEMMNEALWAPDASFVVVAFAPAEDVFDGGRAEIVYLDGRPNVVLADFARRMQWGP